MVFSKRLVGGILAATVSFWASTVTGNLAVTTGGRFWCVAPHVPVGEQIVFQSGASFHGEFRDLSLWVADDTGMMAGCYTFEQKRKGSEGLWVIEFSSEKKLEEEWDKLTTDTDVVATEKLSVVIVASTPPDYEEEDISVIPVSDTAVLPQRPVIERISQLPSSTSDPQIAQLVAGVSEKSLVDFVSQLQNFYTRNSYSQEARDAQDSIIATARAFGLKTSAMAFRGDMSSNVIADLTGSQFPDEIVIVGAHYDSRSTRVNDPGQRAPGADDNGSGSAALMEMARVLAASGQRFKRTVRFAWFSGEEQGLIGSKYMAQQYAASGINVVAMLNLDMVGYRIPGQPIRVGFPQRYHSTQLTELAKTMVQTYTPKMSSGITTACCTDQISFHNSGYPATWFFEHPSPPTLAYPQYHQSTDMLEFFSTEQLALQTQAVLALMSYVAEFATDEFSV